jgi:hypothetical protein
MTKRNIAFYATIILAAYSISTFISFNFNPIKWGEISRLIFLLVISIAVKSKHG